MRQVTVASVMCAPGGSDSTFTYIDPAVTQLPNEQAAWVLTPVSSMVGRGTSIANMFRCFHEGS